MSTFNSIIATKKVPYDPELREYFNIDSAAFSKRTFDYRAFIDNIDSYLNVLYNDMALSQAFLHGLDTSGRVRKTVIECYMYVVSNSYVNLLTNIFFVSTTVLFKTYSYIQSYIFKHQYIVPVYHYWFIEEITAMASLFTIIWGYLYVRPTNKFLRAVLLLFTISSLISLFVLHVPSCSVSENAANLAIFKNSTTHNCYDLSGVYHNETNLPSSKLISKYGYV